MNIVSLENVSKNYGFKPLFEGVTLGLEEKDKIGIIGANGSGKSTLLKVIAGLEEPDTGRVVRAKGKSLAFLAQNPQFDDSLTVLETIFASSGGVMRTILEYETACHDLAAGNDSPKLLERVAELQHELEMNGGWEIETNARTVLSQLAINDTSALASALEHGRLFFEEVDNGTRLRLIAPNHAIARLRERLATAVEASTAPTPRRL